jgi:hypothetical protein
LTFVRFAFGGFVRLTFAFVRCLIDGVRFFGVRRSDNGTDSQVKKPIRQQTK